MCARMSDSNAQVTSVPTWLLRATRNILKGADWARDASDRLVSHCTTVSSRWRLGYCLFFVVCVAEQEQGSGSGFYGGRLKSLGSSVVQQQAVAAEASWSAGVCVGDARSAITSWLCLLLLALCLCVFVSLNAPH